MEKRISCLNRIQRTSKVVCGDKLIRLDSLTKLTLGRSESNDVQLDETTEISRHHAILEKKGNAWFITDVSANGVYVNGRRLVKGAETEIRDRQIIDFGLPFTADQCPTYSFKFYAAVKIRYNRDENESYIKEDIASKEKQLQEERQALEQMKAESEKKLAEMKTELLKTQKDSENFQEQLNLMEKEKLEAKSKQAMLEEERLRIEEALNEKLEKEKLDREKEAEAKRYLSQELEQLQREKAETKQHLSHELEELRREKEQVAHELDAARKLAQEKEEELQQQSGLHSAKVQELEELTNALNEKEQAEAQVNQQLEVMKEQLAAAEKRQLELEAGKKALEEEMSRETKALQHQLNEEVLQLQQQCQTLEQDLQEARDTFAVADLQRIQDLTIQQEQVSKLLKEKEDQQQKLAAAEQKEQRIEDMIEEELVCAICNELFVQAMSLNCSHSFCYYCIERWKLQKSECPSCRSKITSCVRSLVLDNYIDKIVEILSQAMKDERKQLIATRKEEVKSLEAEKLVNAGRQAAAVNSPPRVEMIDLTNVASPFTLYIQRNFPQQAAAQAAAAAQTAAAAQAAGAANRPQMAANVQHVRLTAHQVQAYQQNANAAHAQQQTARQGGAQHNRGANQAARGRGQPQAARSAPYNAQQAQRNYYPQGNNARGRQNNNRGGQRNHYNPYAAR